MNLKLNVWTIISRLCPSLYSFTVSVPNSHSNFIISLVTYILILIWGPMPTEPGGVEVQAVAQKIIMFNFVGSISIQTMAFNKMLKN